MAEFRKVVESVRRMCASYQDCAGCPFEEIKLRSGALYCDIADRHSGVKVTPGEYKTFENIVLDWAAKNPENNKYKCPDESCPMRPLDGYCERSCGNKPKKINIIKLCADGNIVKKSIEDTLEALQKEVGGYIETVRLFSDDDLTGLANEEGWYLKLPQNKLVPGIVGDVIIVGVSGEDFVSVAEPKMQRIMTIFASKRRGSR